MRTPNQGAFLDMLAYSEIGAKLLAISDNGYNVIVGSTPTKPILFASYADHPRRKVNLGNGLWSSAAGRYQILGRYFTSYKKSLNLPDFSPASQDAIALQMIKEQGALPALGRGDFEEAVILCANIWASLPGAGYGQHEHKLSTLQLSYVQAGGSLV